MLAVSFRKYQEDLLSSFELLRAKGIKKYHFVAPPGSGKTLLGLEMMLRMNVAAAVFSPTSAIQAQWIEYCRDFGVGLEASSDPDSEARLLSLTYQSVSIKERGSTELHPNAQKLLEIIKKRPLLIFDECHHLTKEWARILKEAAHDGDNYLIGLTATPPLDKEAQAQETYYELLGPVSAEVTLPPVIKEGYLAPFQDLVYLVSPTDTELELLSRKLQPYKDLMQALRSQNYILPIQFRAEQRLENFRTTRNTIWTYEELWQKKPELCQALVRFVIKYGTELPLSVIPSPEMEEEPDFRDILLVLQDYIYEYLRPLSRESTDTVQKEKAELLIKQCSAALEALGYRMGSRKIHKGQDTVQRLLGKSRGKILAVKPILIQELRLLGEDFRCLILCDYESDKDNDGTGAIELLEFLTEDPETDTCNPILLTGKTILVDDDILEEFLDGARAFIKERGLEIQLTQHKRLGFYEIASPSSLWSTQVYVPLISTMLERGITRTLVSTKSMLGEGWNSIRLNTLIDLTVVSSFAFVNQMRGRTLRLDPQRPLKTANNWDLVTVFPDNEQGYYDLERLTRKYSRFYGLSPQGSIERGIGHLHPMLEGHTPDKLYVKRNDINAQMIKRATERLSVYKKWKVGSPYKNRLLQILDIEDDDLHEEEGSIAPAKALQSFLLAGKILYGINQGLKKICLYIFLSMPFLLIFSDREPFMFQLLIMAFKALLIAGGFAITFRVSTTLKKLIGGILILPGLKRLQKREKILESFCRLIIECACECGLLSEQYRQEKIHICKHPNGIIRISSGNAELSAFVSKALKEFLGPPARQKYCLISRRLLSYKEVQQLWEPLLRKVHIFGKKRHKALHRQNIQNFYSDQLGPVGDEKNKLCAFPVPEAFSKRRKDAELFTRLFRKKISPVLLVGARQSELQERLRPFRYKKALPYTVKHRELWT